MKNIIRTCNLTVKFSKFTLNIEMHEEFVEFLSKLIWRETLFYKLQKLISSYSSYPSQPTEQAVEKSIEI